MLRHWRERSNAFRDSRGGSNWIKLAL